MMIDQDYFTKAYLGLHAQGFRRSVTAEGSKCLYRGLDNCKCAVGQLISDHEYSQAMDDEIWGLPDFQEHRLLQGMPKKLFNRLQVAHDSHSNPTEMRAALHEVAAELHLEVPQC